MITTAFLLIAQMALIPAPTGIGPPWKPPTGVTIPEGVRTGLDVISVDGPGITMFVDPESEDGAVFTFGAPSLVPVPTQAEKDEIMLQAREDADRRWQESHE